MGGSPLKKKEIIKLAKRDFERAWLETASTIKKPHHDDEYPRLTLNTGKTNDLYNTIWDLREAYLRLGFEETINPLFIDEDQIYRQFGPEAPAVLDRCFYLAGLPRPDIGISLDKIEKIEKLGVPLDEEKIQGIKDVFRQYKKGDSSGDDLVLDLSTALDVENEIGLRVLEQVFPELRELTPIANKTTLRSHMTSGWFITLHNLYKKRNMPLKLFSIDRCFRREQKEDSSHLMTYHSASCIWMDDEVSLDLGMAISESLLEYFGFEKFRFQPDEKKSKYYIPGTQTEVYGFHPQLKEWVEVATFGLYSPIALAQYGIDHEVMNLGVGAERIAMIMHEYKDVREMVYPQINAPWIINDRQIASMLRMNTYPVTDDGLKLKDSLINIFEDKGSEESPCEFVAFEGDMMGKTLKVSVVEPEKGTRLLGPAAWNQVYIYQGNVIGVPPEAKIDDELSQKALKNGINTNIRYMDGIAAKAAYLIEEMLVSGEHETEIRVTIAKAPSDINLILDKVALNYITSKQGVIDIRGPIFSTIKAEII